MTTPKWEPQEFTRNDGSVISYDISFYKVREGKYLRVSVRLNGRIESPDQSIAITDEHAEEGLRQLAKVIVLRM